jgi:hypothetical protein
VDARVYRKVLLVAVTAILVLIAGILVRSIQASANIPFKYQIRVVFWRAVYAADASTKDIKNLSKLHHKPERLSENQCIACHGIMRESRKTQRIVISSLISIYTCSCLLKIFRARLAIERIGFGANLSNFV